MAPVWALLPSVSEKARNNASTPMRSATFLLMLSSRFVCPPWCSACLISCSTSCWTAWTPCVMVFLHHGVLLAPKRTSQSPRPHAQEGIPVRFGCLQVDDKIKLDWFLHRYIGRLCALQDSTQPPARRSTMTEYQ